MGPDNSNTVPAKAALIGRMPSTRPKVYAPVPAMTSLASTITV